MPKIYIPKEWLPQNPPISNDPENNNGCSWFFGIIFTVIILWVIGLWCIGMMVTTPDIFCLTLYNLAAVFILGSILWLWLDEDYGCFIMLFIFIAFVVGFLTMSGAEEAPSMTRTILISAAILFSIIIFLPPILRYRLKVKRDRRAKQEQAEYNEEQELALKQKQSDIRQFIESNNLLSASVVIDSDIWTSPTYRLFFDILNDYACAQNSKIIIYRPQYNEICGHKKHVYLRKHRNMSARNATDLAINRLNHLSKIGLLSIMPINFNPIVDDRSESWLLRLLATLALTHGTAYLLTDNIELQTRARGYTPWITNKEVAKNVSANIVVLDVETLRSNC